VGEGEVTGGGQTFPVHAREQAIVSGGDQITYDVERLRTGCLGPVEFVA